MIYQTIYVGYALSRELLSVELALEGSNLASLPIAERRSLLSQIQEKIFERSEPERAKALPEQTTNITLKPFPKPTEYTPEILRIGTDRNLLITILNNLESLRDLPASAKKKGLSNVSIYQSEDGRYTDFWKKLVFTKQSGEFKDTTGFFKGVLKGSREALVKESRLSKTGFYAERNITNEEEEENVLGVKKIIVEIAHFRGIPVSRLMAMNKPLSAIESLVFMHDYPLKPDDVVEVCLCGADHCESSCKEIKTVKRSNFL